MAQYVNLLSLRGGSPRMKLGENSVVFSNTESQGDQILETGGSVWLWLGGHSSCWIKAHRAQESSSIGGIVCPLMEMPVVTFWAADFCCDTSPVSYLFPKPGPPQPILWTHSICYCEISSRDKLAKLHFQFFLKTLIGIFSKLAPVGVVN